MGVFRPNARPACGNFGDGERNGLEVDLDEALQTRPALEIVNDTLLAGMKVVVVACRENGDVDLDDLRAKVATMTLATFAAVTAVAVA